MSKLYKPTVEQGGDIVGLERDAQDLVRTAAALEGMMKLHQGSVLIGIKPVAYITTLRHLLDEAKKKGME